MTLSTAMLLYLVFALGAAGVYLLLPRADRPLVGAGVVFSVAALAALLVVMGVRLVAPGTGSPYFYLFAAVALAACTRCITHPKPVYCVLYFVLVVVAVAALLVLQQAEFLAVALVIIYAGAILVTYVFVIMLAQQRGRPIYDRRAREPLLATAAGFVLMAAVAGKASEAPAPVAPAAAPVRVAQEDGAAEHAAPPAGNTADMGAVVTTKFVVVLQLAGVLLLISMVGAVALSRKRMPVEALLGPARALGQVGKEVKPF